MSMMQDYGAKGSVEGVLGIIEKSVLWTFSFLFPFLNFFLLGQWTFDK